MDEPKERKSIIIHVDLDCFYCQVEQIRLGIPFEIPFVVQQWGSLIAVNYAARAYGIKRMMLLNQALKLCPALESAHTATIALGATEAVYHKNPTKSTHKVSLEPYRDASEKIHTVLRRVAGPLCAYERGGTDEAFIDLSTRVEKEFVGKNLSDDVVASSTWPTELGNLLRDETTPMNDFGTWSLAAEICAEMRAAVKEELGYNCSAGISSSKTVSKLLSSKFKPNMQTTILPSGVKEFMRNIAVNKIRGFGGIFGEKVTQLLGVETCGDLWSLARKDLLRKFDLPTIEYIMCASNGTDVEEAVKEKPQSKSILAAKNFPPTREVMPWVHVLVAELDQRVTRYIHKNSNIADFIAAESIQSLTLSYPKTVTVVLKWFEVAEETEESYEIASRDTKTLTKTFAFQVPPRHMLSTEPNVATNQSRCDLLQTVLSHLDILMADENIMQRFTAISISIHNFVECAMTREHFFQSALPTFPSGRRRLRSTENTTLDKFLSGKKAAPKPIKTETDAAGKVWIDLTDEI